MMIKKIYSTIRSWVLLFVQILIPVAFLIVAIVVVRSWKAFNDLPPLRIGLDSYMYSYTVVNGSDSNLIPYRESYSDIIRNTRTALVDIGTSDMETYILKKVYRELLVSINTVKSYLYSNVESPI